ncbi:MAG: IS630 family transposase, partial [Candidatus Cloacimonetes bacterium]|nr:IS630 family transposase [Candidatus Cloacimonadota bacterium]MDD2230636.1 IS630 family transposase [Candidatus Cloacimonadota bacterium]
VSHWVDDRNKRNSSINWQFTTKDSRVKLKRLYPTFDD